VKGHYVDVHYLDVRGLEQVELVHFFQLLSAVPAGISRSVTHVIGYLMRFDQLSLLQALQLVQAKRPCASPNSGFMRALAEVELELHGIASLDLNVYSNDRFSSCAALQLKTACCSMHV
jgi:Dual specificity phosphatase, catalytic domain